VQRFLRPGDTAVDIGANIGYYVLLESAVASKGRIFATAPSAFNRKLLQMNLELNKVQTARVYPFAFAEKTESQREFYLYKHTNWTSFNKNLDSEIVETTQVRTISIDDFRERFMGGVAPTAMRMQISRVRCAVT